jgi:DNA segregation ATPase FtsK/SpoIIIE-like protein
MKEILKKIAYPLMMLSIVVLSSTPRYASAQNDGYYDDNTNNSYDNNNYSYNDDNYQDDQYNDAQDYEVQPSDVNINVFQNALSPYGNWVVSASYGQAWVPRYRGFVPYSTNGHWIYSSYGWTWASSYNWGWAPFHYGRWVYDPMYGWMWIPGYEWGPAWVSWRTGGGYYGWSPLGPGMNIGVNIGIGIPYNRWVFAPCRYMGYRNINRYYVRPSHNTTIIRNTTIINNTTVINNRRFVAGPNRSDVERVTGRPVNRVRIENASRPGATVTNRNGNTVQMYRPGVKQKAQTTIQNRRENGNLSPQRQEQINKGKDIVRNRRENAQSNNNNPQTNVQRNTPAPDQRDRINSQQNQQELSNRQKRLQQQRQQQQMNNNRQQPNSQQVQEQNNRQQRELRQQQRNEERQRSREQQMQQQRQQQMNNQRQRVQPEPRMQRTPPVMQQERRPQFNQPQRQQPSAQPRNGGGNNRSRG